LAASTSFLVLFKLQKLSLECISIISRVKSIRNVISTYSEKSFARNAENRANGTKWMKYVSGALSELYQDLLSCPRSRITASLVSLAPIITSGTPFPGLVDAPTLFITLERYGYVTKFLGG
jgi:hypothetical protein